MRAYIDSDTLFEMAAVESERLESHVNDAPTFVRSAGGAHLLDPSGRLAARPEQRTLATANFTEGPFDAASRA